MQSAPEQARPKKGNHHNPRRGQRVIDRRYPLKGETRRDKGGEEGQKGRDEWKEKATSAGLRCIGI